MGIYIFQNSLNCTHKNLCVNYILLQVFLKIKFYSIYLPYGLTSKHFLFTSRMGFNQTNIPGLVFPIMVSCTQSSSSPPLYWMHMWGYRQKVSRNSYNTFNITQREPDFIRRDNKCFLNWFFACAGHKTKCFQKLANVCSHSEAGGIPTYKWGHDIKRRKTCCTPDHKAYKATGLQVETSPV